MTNVKRHGRHSGKFSGIVLVFGFSYLSYLSPLIQKFRHILKEKNVHPLMKTEYYCHQQVQLNNW